MMKKALQLLAVAALLMAAQGNAWAYDGTVVAPSGQTLYYDYVDSTGSVTIVRPTSSGWGTETQPTGVLVIPDSVAHNGTMYPVTAIGDHAFSSCQGLTAVTFPQGVTVIGASAFSSCRGIMSLTVPDWITVIGDYAFDGIRHIEYHGSATWTNRVYWGAHSMNGVTSGDFVFADSTLTTLTCYLGNDSAVAVPSTVTAIGPRAFDNNDSLAAVTFPEGMTTVGAMAFRFCFGLTSVGFSSTVTAIGEMAFMGCEGLSPFTVPNGVDTIGRYAFFSIGQVIYHGSATYEDDDLYWGAYCLNGVMDGDFLYADSTRTTLTRYLGSDTVVTVPPTVTAIGQGAFAEYEQLVSVTLPEGLTSIGDEAFTYCWRLTAIDIPAGVTAIGNGAFNFCSSLASVTIPDGVTTIEGWLFAFCESLPSINIPAGVDSIGVSAFMGCTGLVDIYAKAATAPALGTTAFNGVPRTATIHIPCGSQESYAEGWTRFENFSEEMMYRLEVLSADSAMGGVEVLTEPTCQQEAVVQATANPGYVFEGWSITPGYQNLVTDNPLTLTVTEDMTLVAHFAPDGVGIGVIEKGELKIEIIGNSLSVNNPDGEAISVYDIAGRQLATSHLSIFTYQLSNPGVYLVQVGSRPAQKVVVIKSN